MLVGKRGGQNSRQQGFTGFRCGGDLGMAAKLQTYPFVAHPADECRDGRGIADRQRDLIASRGRNGACDHDPVGRHVEKGDFETLAPIDGLDGLFPQGIAIVGTKVCSARAGSRDRHCRQPGGGGILLAPFLEDDALGAAFIRLLAKLGMPDAHALLPRKVSVGRQG